MHEVFVCCSWIYRWRKTENEEPAQERMYLLNVDMNAINVSVITYFGDFVIFELYNIWDTCTTLTIKDLLDDAMVTTLYLGLIDILFGYAYNVRINEGDENVSTVLN